MSKDSSNNEEVYNASDDSFYESVNWENIKFNVIPKEKYLDIKARNSKIFATFLGDAEAPSFYMFKPLKWGVYKDIKSKKLDKDSINEYILNTSVLWPKMDVIDLINEDAGIVLTLVYQIMACSNFLENPSMALENLFPVS